MENEPNEPPAKPCDYYEITGACPVLQELDLQYPAQCQQPLSDDEIWQ